MDISSLMKQAQEMQGKMKDVQDKLAKMTITGSAGGGMVEVIVNGQGDVVSVKIEDPVVSVDEKDMLQDLIAAATNDGIRKAKELSKQEMGGLTGGMNLPDLTNFMQGHLIMHVVPPALERLIETFSQLPGIGKKTATRLALNLLRKPPENSKQFAEALLGLHENIQLCSCCFTFSEDDPCNICAAQNRNGELVCVVEEPGDLLAIEKTSSYQGHYHVLHGVLSPIDGIGPDEIKVKELKARAASGAVREILIATSSTVPGEATASFLTDSLKNYPIKLTRLACGIPMGMDIKYADKYTLAKAIESRSTAE